MAHTVVDPATHRSGPLKGPLEQARAGSASLEGSSVPRAGSASLEGSRLPRAGSASLEGSRPPRAGSASLEGSPPPRSRLPRTRARSRARVRAFNALTRRGGAIMPLGITPRPCCTNSQGGTHPRYCGGLCDVAGASPVTPRRLLPYGQRAVPSKGGRPHPRTTFS
jgi:hypothetical protein